eukprot:7355193-Pyramimonas_sp.AAC.1
MLMQTRRPRSGALRWSIAHQPTPEHRLVRDTLVGIALVPVSDLRRVGFTRPELMFLPHTRIRGITSEIKTRHPSLIWGCAV